MSVSEHSRCSQSLYAIRLLRCHGLSDGALQIIFKTVVPLYPVAALCRQGLVGFTSADDRQRIAFDGFIRHAVRAGLYITNNIIISSYIRLLKLDRTQVNS